MTQAPVQVGFNPWMVTLLWAGVGAIVLAGILGIMAYGEGGTYLADVDRVVALNQWSNFLLLAGVITLVGACVVAGVEWTLRNARHNS